MISILRAQSQEQKKELWSEVLKSKNEFQESLADRGRLLYLSQRAEHNEVSLFIHVIDPDTIADFIAEKLTKIPHITGLWIINLFKPVFHPLPKDTRDLIRYVVTMKVFPDKLKEVYDKLSSLELPDGIYKAYLAYTFHLFGDCIMLSVLAGQDSQIAKDAHGIISNMPGVLAVHIDRIEKTHPLISYEEWKAYAAEHGIVSAWRQTLMIQQFEK